MKEFCESYYHHTCLIIPEKDVLDTDIFGTGWIANIKWWWNDLFLLSYSNEQSRSFYNSSHAMKLERFRQFRRYRNRIHPMSKFRSFWNCLMLYTFVLDKFLFRFTSTFMFDHLPLFLFYLGALIDFIIIVDLYVSIKTGYIDYEGKRVILDTKKCLYKFCCQKLFIHVASTIPLHWLLLMRYGTNVTCGLCKSNRFICALKIVSVFSLFRVYETSKYWTRKRYTTKIHFYKFLRILVTGLLTIFQFSDLIDTFALLVFIENGYVYEKSNLAMRMRVKYDILKSVKQGYKFMFMEIYRNLNVFFKFTFVVKPKTFFLDKLAAVAAFVIANIFYVWSLIECFALISSIMYSKDQEVKMRTNAMNFIICKQLSEEIRVKVDQYFNLKTTKTAITERRNGLCKSLPVVFKNEVKFISYMKMIMRIPLFSDWPLSMIEEVVLIIQPKVYLCSDIVALARVEGSGLMIVDTGILAVYSELHEETGHLIDGDYFGELSLVTDHEVCMSYVVAVTNCNLLVVGKLLFRSIMKKYPDHFNNLKIEVKSTHNVPDKGRPSIVPHIDTS